MDHKPHLCTSHSSGTHHNIGSKEQAKPQSSQTTNSMVFYNFTWNYKYCPQEVREIRSRYESHLVEVDSGRQKEFESKLAEAMQQLRQEHESQIQQYKEDMERTFNAKVCNQGTLPHF